MFCNSAFFIQVKTLKFNTDHKIFCALKTGLFGPIETVSKKKILFNNIKIMFKTEYATEKSDKFL